MDARLERLLPEKADERVLRELRERIDRYASRPQDEVEQRLEALEREWDLERALLLDAAVLSGVGLALGVTVGRKWLLLPGVVAGFLLQHALTGWSPPVAVLRLLKCRSRRELDAETFALRVQRGDFRGVEVGHSASSEGPGWG